MRNKQFAVKGKLITPHYIETDNHRNLRLTERRDDDIGIYMYWLLELTKNGKYEVIKRIDPRYCESEE